jgi:hypothetical protein
MNKKTTSANPIKVREPQTAQPQPHPFKQNPKLIAKANQ